MAQKIMTQAQYDYFRGNEVAEARAQKRLEGADDYTFAFELDVEEMEELNKPVDFLDLEWQFREAVKTAIKNQADFWSNFRKSVSFSFMSPDELKRLRIQYARQRLEVENMGSDYAYQGRLFSRDFSWPAISPEYQQAVVIYNGIINKLDKAIDSKEARRK